VRHIKIYEEYSDEEIKDLMGDLKSIGLSYAPELGVDYGYTNKFLKEAPKDLGRPLNVLFTPEVVDYMVKKGIAEYSGWSSHDKERYAKFLPKGEWMVYGVPYLGNDPVELGLIRQHQAITKTELYILSGVSVDQGFGNAVSKRMSPSSRLYCLRWFLKKFGEVVKEKGTI
jgi:hypothetical protein